MTREEAIRYLERHGFIDDEVKDMCIEALEKQIPKAVINQDDFYDYAECPSCNYPARDFIGCMYEWCRNCGQRLKVGEENG